MLPSNQRSAVAALDSARAVVARLDTSRHPDDVAADLIESWSAVETALRSLLGGSALTGQALVSEVRQRGLLDYAHAHALLGFLAARDRASRTDYQPTEMDVDAARSGFQAIEAALGVGIGADTATYPAVRVSGAGAGIPPAPLPPRAPGGATQAAGAATAASAATRPTAPDAYQPPVPDARRRGPGLLLAIVALVLVLAVGLWVWLRGGSPSSLNDGVAAFQRGDRVTARRDFEQAAADRPKMAIPHVYLARMARQDGDMPRAFSELKTAVELEPQNEVALREMGQYLLQAGQPAQAVKWFERALRIDGTDRVAAGWMGCALLRQGQTDLATRFFQRAGSGDWNACQQAASPAYPGAAPTGGAPGVGTPGVGTPGAVPPGAVVPGAPPAAPGAPLPRP